MANVLLVEDDTNVCELVAAALRREALAVTCTDNAYDAVHSLATGVFDVVVLDMMLRASSGMYVIDAVRRIAPARRPRVLVTTGASMEALRALDRTVVKAVVFKPVDLATFSPLVRIEAERAAAVRPRL